MTEDNADHVVCTHRREMAGVRSWRWW